MAFGADRVINVSDVPNTADRVAAVHELTDGGADVVLELVGSPDLLPEGVAMLGRGGTFVEIGLFFSGRTVAFDPSTLVMSGKRIIGSNGYRPFLLPVILDYLVTAQDLLPFDQLVSHRFALDEGDRGRSVPSPRCQGARDALPYHAPQPTGGYDAS